MVWRDGIRTSSLWPINAKLKVKSSPGCQLRCKGGFIGSRLAGLVVCFALLIAFAPAEAGQLACPAVVAKGRGHH
jgi:hypothetical protein